MADNDCNGGKHPPLLLLLSCLKFSTRRSGGDQDDFFDQVTFGLVVGVAQLGGEGSTCDDDQVVLGEDPVSWVKVEVDLWWWCWWCF